MRQYKKTVKDYKKENFREQEKKSLTKSIGTSGPKVRPDGTTKDDKPKVTDKQKEEFREQEETYLTKSPGTAGDKYYKNPEGTGTGQGGSGIPVEKDEESSPVISNVTTNTQPQYESSSFGYFNGNIALRNFFKSFYQFQNTHPFTSTNIKEIYSSIFINKI